MKAIRAGERLKAVLCAAICVLVAALAAGGAAAQEKTVPETKAQVEYSFAPLVKRTAPGVVNIYTRTVVRQQVSPLFDDPFFRRFFGEGFPGLSRERVERSLGSGTIVDPSGIIVTNRHVIANADQITVALADRREFEAQVLRSDERTDLAILKIDTGGEALPFLKFGDPDELEVGDLVLAIGDPFNVGQTVTSGIVSALARTQIGVGDFRSFIQTDAAINPGNSGGPLVDSHGDLIGINTAIYSRGGGSIGIGFAIPASTAKMVLEQIVKTGSVTRGWIGVEVQEITAGLADSFKLGETKGVIIAGVLRGGPADKAGVKPGDVLLQVGDKPVAGTPNMLNVVAALAPGSHASLKLKRDGKDVAVEVVVGKRPKPQQRPE